MGRVQVSSELTAHAEIAKQIERFQGDLAAAKSHSLGRDRRVGQVMCYLSLMRSAGLIQNSATVSCTKAIRQHYKSSSAEGKQAAHYLPGQLRINSQCPWVFISDQHNARKLEGLFGDVEDLPTNFNKADTAAEAYWSVEGLKESFEQSCRIVVQGSQQTGKTRIDRAQVRYGYNEWITYSRRAYRNAIAQKEAKINVPSLKVGALGYMEFGMRDPANMDARQNAMQRGHHYIVQAEFLRQYLATSRVETLTDFLMNEIEQNFSELATIESDD